jgi:hypothetical protein
MAGPSSSAEGIIGSITRLRFCVFHGGNKNAVIYCLLKAVHGTCNKSRVEHLPSQPTTMHIVRNNASKSGQNRLCYM